MKRLYILCFVLIAFVSVAQEKFIQSQLDEYNEHITTEYIDIHFDKDVYFAGEKIWYALYLNNVPRNLSTKSLIAYVEIRDRSDSVLYREKIRCFEGLGHGDITLSKKLATGNYLVTAFTLSMKSTNSLYRSIISVVNADIPLPLPKADLTATLPVDLKIIKSGIGRFKIQANKEGKIIVHDRERVLFSKQVVSNDTITLLCEKNTGKDVFISITDSKGAILEMHQVRNDRSDADLKVSFGRKELKSGQKVGVTIELIDDQGLPLNGQVSVSVHEDFKEIGEIPNRIVSNDLFAYNKDIALVKENLIYPVSKNSLVPLLTMKISEPYPLLLTDSTRKKLISAGTRRRIMNAYAMDPVFLPEHFYLLPADLSYVPSNYVPLPTVEVFIKELVSQVKIVKTHDGKKMKLRNITPNKVTLFPEPALLLVDGFIVENANEFLDIPLKDINRIDLTWASDKINTLGVFSLADNGIVSVTTTNPGRFSTNHTNLFKDIDIPMQFNLPGLQDNQDHLPAFQNPLYWNPALRIEGRVKFEIQAGDHVGNYIIEIHGFSDRGNPLFFSMPLVVYKWDNK